MVSTEDIKHYRTELASKGYLIFHNKVFANDLYRDLQAMKVKVEYVEADVAQYIYSSKGKKSVERRIKAKEKNIKG